jgi:hypothetical protein
MTVTVTDSLPSPTLPERKFKLQACRLNLRFRVTNSDFKVKLLPVAGYHWHWQ